MSERSNQLPLISQSRKSSQNEVPKSMLSVLMPEKSNIIRIDDQRSILIMDRLIHKVILISNFHKISGNIQPYCLLMGAENIKLFQMYIPLVKEYEKLLEEKRNLSMKMTDKEDVDGNYMGGYIELDPKKENEVRDSLSELTRKLLRSLLEDRIIATTFSEHFKQWSSQTSLPMRLLRKKLVDLRFLIIRELVSTSAERRARDDFEIEEKIKGIKYDRRINRLRLQLAKIFEDHYESIRGIPEEIQRLRSEVLNLEKETIMKKVEINKLYQQRIKSMKAKHKLKTKMMETDLQSEKDNFSNLFASNQANLKKIRIEKWKYDQIVFDKHETIDIHLMDIQSEIITLSNEYDNVCADYDTLYLEYQPLKVEYDAIMVERAEMKAKEEQEAQIRLENAQSAIILQSCWRSWKERKRLKTLFKRRI